MIVDGQQKPEERHGMENQRSCHLDFGPTSLLNCVNGCQDGGSLYDTHNIKITDFLQIVSFDGQWIS